MREKNGAITKFNNWLFGDLLSEDCFEPIDISAFRHLAQFCLFLSLAFLVLYFGLSNYLIETPEPKFWINIVEPWLKEVMFIK